MKDKLISIIKNNSERVFINDAINENSYTYNDIHILSLKMISIFNKYGLSVGDRVSIVTENSIEAVIVYFAALYYGITIIPISSKLTENEASYILENSKSKYLIVTSLAYEKQYYKHNIKNIKIKLSDVNNESYIENKPFFNIDKNEESLIIYSSGTTGRPKAIVHSFFNLARNASLFNNKMDIGNTNVFFNFLNLTYLGGYYNLLMLPFMAEGRVVLFKQFDLSLISKIPKLIEEYKVNTLWLVPAIASILVKFDRLNDETKSIYNKFIDLCLIGTAPLSQRLKMDFENKYNLKLYQNYGLSETLFISVDTISEDDCNIVGDILEDIEIKVLDNGEILVKTPYMMHGYLDEDIMKSSFEQEWFKTGDIGIVKDNKLIFNERKKDIIIRGGENISPKEIENTIQKLDFVDDVVVIGVEHDIYGEDIIAFIISIGDTKNECLHEVRQICEDELSSNKIPSNFIFVDSFPRTDSGKIDKKQLRRFI